MGLVTGRARKLKSSLLSDIPGKKGLFEADHVAG